MRKDLFDIIGIIKQNKKITFSLSILSNGTCINTAIADKLKKLDVHNIQISLDGGTKKTHDAIRGRGNFEKAIEAIKLLKRKNFRVTVQTVIHRQNIHEIPVLIDVCRKTGVDTLGISRLIPLGSGKKMRDLMLAPFELKNFYQFFAREREKRSKPVLRTHDSFYYVFFEKENNNAVSCSIGFTGITLQENGDLLACRRCPVFLGNIRRDTFKEIWEESEVLWNVRIQRFSGKCGDCTYLGICGGGCRGIPYGLNGDYLGEDIQCWCCQ